MTTTTFQRARSEEQRAARRRAILDAAAAMLAEMPVAGVTLNELSRRVGLAKSNVLRYFESREAVLLELLDAAWQDWLAELGETLASPGQASRAGQGGLLAEVLTATLESRPVLCDLLSAQAAVLERNISPDIAATYKRTTIANVSALARLAAGFVPELSQDDSMKFAGATTLVAGAVWTTTQPSAAMLVAYESDPELAALRLDFRATLRELLDVLLAGLLARSQS